jgi:hypothetical protein
MGTIVAQIDTTSTARIILRRLLDEFDAKADERGEAWLSVLTAERASSRVRAMAFGFGRSAIANS